MNDLVFRRMHAQRLWGPGATTIADVVRTFGAMQAQEFGAAKWSIAQRIHNEIPDAEIQAAYDSGTLLRTHLLRPTWHFVHADDIRWILRATASRIHALNAHYYRASGVDDELASRALRIFESALSGGDHLTRPELAARLASAGLPSSGLPLTLMVMHAELDGVLVSGAMRNRRHTYTLMDLRVPAAETGDRGEAIVRLCRTYLRGHAPATERDLATWASLTLTEVRRGLAALHEEAATARIGDRTYHFIPADDRIVLAADGTALALPPSPRIDILQDYDEALVGYSESRDVLFRPDGPARALVARWRAMLLDGGLIGYWRHTAGRGGIDVQIQPSRPLDGAEEVAVDAAVSRFGRFLGAPVRWQTRNSHSI